MKGFNKYIIFLIISLFSLNIKAQVLQVNAELNKNTCLIGDHLTLTLTLSKPIHKIVIFPAFNDTISSSIEIINKGTIDTVLKENQQIKLKQTFTITTFDTGLITLPSIPFLVQNDTIYDTLFSNQLLFTVHALPVDTVKQSIYDIKPPITEPFSWKEIAHYILWGLLGLLIIAAAIYVYFRIKNKKPIIPFPEKPQDPPYVIALKELQLLKDKKLWQKQLYKQYYSELTDILRVYLEKQFQIPAMESLSYEIVRFLKEKSFNDELVKNMQSLLTTADLVKFAKATPLPDENDWHWKNAIAFVEQTKPVEVDNEKETKGGYE